MLSRIFNRKPRLDHPKPTKRLEALAALPDADQQTIFQVAVEDEAHEVRLAALQRISDTADLAKLLDDSVLAEEAVRLVCKKIDSNHSLMGHAAVRSHVLGSIESGKELAELAHHQTNSKAIAETIFVASSAHVRHDAIKHIVNLEVLTHCERISRNKDKSINRYIRERLTEVKRLQNKRDETLARAEQLIESANRANPADAHYSSVRIAQEQNWEASLTELTALNEQLHECGVEKLDLDMLRARFPRRTKSLDADEPDPHRFNEIIGKLRSAENPTAALAEAEEEWLEALRVQKVPVELSNEFFELTAEIRADQKHGVARDHLEERYAKLTAEELALPNLDDRDAWPQLWQIRKRAKQQCHTIDRFYGYDEFVALDEATQNTWRQRLESTKLMCETIVQRADELFESTEIEIKSTLEQVSEKLSAGELAEATKAERNVRSLILRLPESARKRHFDALMPISGDLKQLLNWKSFATLPKREELCHKIEALVSEPKPPQEQFDQIRALRDDWKALGPPSNREEGELQQRYDEAAEKAWLVCAEWFELQKQQRAENANRKEALARDLEIYEQETDWENVDWREVQQTLSQHGKQFKEIGRVDQSRYRTIKKRFDRAFQTIRDRLNKHREQVSEVKQSLIEKVQSIAIDEELDRKARVDSVKEIQAQWKYAGRTFFKDEERLWREFQQACNEVFENLRQQWKDRNESIGQNIDEAKSLVKQLQDQAQKNPQDLSPSHLQEVEKKLDDMFLPVRVQRDLNRKLGQIEDIIAGRKHAAVQMQISERLRLLLEKDVELSGYESSDSPIPDEWFDAVDNDMVLFETRAPLEDASALLDIVLQAEIAAGIEASSSEEEERRLQLRVGALSTTMKQSRPTPQSTAEDLIKAWLGVAHGEQPLRERFRSAIEVVLKQIAD